MPCWSNDAGRRYRQHLHCSLHCLLARKLWDRHEPGHTQRGRLLTMPRRHVRVRRRRFDVHCVPCWHHHDGRGHGQHLGLGLHCVRAGLLRSRDEPGHNKRGRLHGLPCRHLLVGRRHLQRLRLYCMPSWRHDGGRRRRQRLRCGLHYVRARLFWRRYEPGHNKRRRLLGMPRRHLLRGRRRLQRLFLHVLPQWFLQRDCWRIFVLVVPCWISVFSDRLYKQLKLRAVPAWNVLVTWFGSVHGMSNGSYYVVLQDG